MERESGAQEQKPFESWGIVEVMGHRKYPGRITEQLVAGTPMVRVDVPTVTKQNGEIRNEFTKLIGAGSIYMITPTSEDVARRMAVALAYDDPLPVYVPESRQLAAVTDAAIDDEDDDDIVP